MTMQDIYFGHSVESQPTGFSQESPLSNVGLLEKKMIFHIKMGDRNIGVNDNCFSDSKSFNSLTRDRAETLIL